MSDTNSQLRQRRQTTAGLQTLDDDSFVDETEPNAYQTYIVIKTNEKIQPEALRWLTNKIKAKRSDGGAELVVRQQRRNDYVLHVSASGFKLLEAAEQMEMQKLDRMGQLREFQVMHLEDFLGEGQTVYELLTVAERQTIVRHELENIRNLALDQHIPGYPKYLLYGGQSILQEYQRHNLITEIYALHETDELKKLGHIWYRTLIRKQPIEAIRSYFGEAIALYFTFIGFYTTALLIPMFLGFLQLLTSAETVPFFCVLNVLWVTIFLEMWKRRSNELAFKWGTIGMTSLDEPRANYHGQMGKDPVSGKLRPQYPRWKTYVKMYAVSLPIVVACMVLAFGVMLASFWLEARFVDLSPLPSVLYAALVYLMNCQYRKLATFLTEWENHRTQSQYDRHRVTKLVLFECVNNFMSLFYIAFIIQDMEMLRGQLRVMLVIQQTLNHFQEALLPLVLRASMQKVTDFKLRRKSSALTIQQQNEENYKDDEAATVQGFMSDYEGTFDDYLELFIQFGYVVLFSSVYPIAAFWAVLNNVIEVRADAFKLCVVLRRPMARRVKDIGAWQNAFEILGGISIVTNCGLLALSPRMKTRFEHQDPVTWWLGFVALEHILLGIRFILHKGIPDRPEWIRVELARRNYKSRQALKNERNQRSRHILTRRFKTIHGPHHTSHNAFL